MVALASPISVDSAEGSNGKSQTCRSFPCTKTFITRTSSEFRFNRNNVLAKTGLGTNAIMKKIPPVRIPAEGPSFQRGLEPPNGLCAAR